MRVAEETRKWEQGKCLLFDDAYEHEVWYHRRHKETGRHEHDCDKVNLASTNEIGQERVVLLLDVWHPDLTLEERMAVMDMFDGAKQEGWLT